MGHIVLHRNRLIQRVVFHHVEDRGKGFFAHRVGLFGHHDQRGRHIGPTGGHAIGDGLTAVNGRTFGPCGVQLRQHPVPRTRIDQRPDQRALGTRITNRQRCIGRAQTVDQITGHGGMHDQPAQRGTTLTGGADGGKHDCTHRHVQIGRGRDDHRVVAAQFQNAAPPAGRNLGPNDRAHAGRTGRRQDRHALGHDHGLTHLGAADDQLRQIIGRIIAKPLNRAVQDFHTGHRGQGRLFRRFPDDRVPTDQCNRRVPRPDRNGEVERRDDPHRPDGVPCFRHPVTGAFGCNRQPVQLARQTDREIADVDHLLHFAQTLGRDFTGLQRDHRAQFVLGRAQFLAQEAHQLTTARRGDLTPCGKRRARLCDHGGHVRRIGLGHMRHNGPVDGRGHGQSAAR